MNTVENRNQFVRLGAMVIAAVFLAGWVGCAGYNVLPESADVEPVALQGLSPVPADTVLAASLLTPLQPGKNVLWTSALPLVFHELGRANGKKIALSPSNATCREVLQQAGDMEGVMPSRTQIRYLSLAGEPIRRPTDGGAFRVSVLMQAKLRYPVPFEQTSGRFNGKKGFEFFGCDAVNGLPESRGNVLVLHHQFPAESKGQPVSFAEAKGQHQFVIELLNDTADERLIVSVLPKSASLAQAIDKTMKYVRKPSSTRSSIKVPKDLCTLEMPPETMSPTQLDATKARMSKYKQFYMFEPLAIPSVNVAMETLYPALASKKIDSPGGQLDGYTLARVEQMLRFRLDEKGCDFVAEAHGGLFAGESPYVRRFVVEGPFLILLLRKGQPMPYMAAWIANTELLVPEETSSGQ
jgi:hypothetical protein